MLGEIEYLTTDLYPNMSPFMLIKSDSQARILFDEETNANWCANRRSSPMCSTSKHRTRLVVSNKLRPYHEMKD
jgi:hypothetical protein